ncbi:hypothetical protein GCM10009541_60770 [Micromonospora gifhornensis]
MPPAATARTTAAEVQLAGVPVPTVRVGREVSTARPAAGTATAPPDGLRPPPVGVAEGTALALREGLALAVCGTSCSPCSAATALGVSGAASTAGGWPLRGSALGTDGPQADRTVTVTPSTTTAGDLRGRLIYAFCVLQG